MMADDDGGRGGLVLVRSGNHLHGDARHSREHHLFCAAGTRSEA
jgi:hypothetical protein